MTKPSALGMGCFAVQMAFFLGFCALLAISVLYMVFWQVDPLAPPEPPTAVCLDGTQQKADPHEGLMIDTVCQHNGGFDHWVE
jgi:hypothetical protein